MKNNISKKKEEYSSVGSNITANEVDRVTILWVKKIQRFNKYVRAKPAIYLQFYKNRCEDLYTTFSITQPRSREEITIKYCRVVTLLGQKHVLTSEIWKI